MATAHLDRRMLAILAADVVGYSRLMEADEPGTIARLKSVRGDLAEPLISEHHGRLVKLMGDGALVVFDSVVDAVGCAIEIQKAVALRNAELSEPERIVFRIGVNLGDVALVDGDVYGDGVNVAARLEQLCDPGGVMVSGTAYDQLHGKLDVILDDAGPQQVKNIARPVRAYRVRIDGVRPTRVLGLRRGLARRRLATGAVAAVLVLLLVGAGGYALRERRTAEPTASSTQPSLIVLPFANMSDDPSLDYFSDGITEDLTAQLAQNPELKVVARSTAFGLKDKPTDMRQLGRDLGVSYALESSVRKSGDKVRIVAQLIDTASGHHVWADRYDEEGGDVFSLQDRVASKILFSLGGFHGQIRQAGYQQVWAKPTASLEEYDYFLRIHDLIVSGDADALSEARRLAEDGLRRYPQSGFLKIKLGWTYMQRVDRGLSDDPGHDLAQAYDLGKEGLAHRDLTALARLHGHWLMALVELYGKRDYAAALGERDAALALAPSDTAVQSDLARVAVYAGKPELVTGSLPELVRALASGEEDPWLRSQLGWAYCISGQPGLGVAEVEGLEATDGYIKEIEAYCYGEAGMREEAREAVTGLLASNPSYTLAAARELNPYKSEAVLKRYLDVLREAGLPEN